MKNPLIQYKNITLAYEGRTLYSDLNFSVQQGEKLLVSGKSGTGKTSLIKLLLGFMTPDKGSILFNNKKVVDQVAWIIRQQTAYVTQNLDIGGGRVASIIQDILSFKSNSETGEVEKFKWLDFLELKKEILENRFEDLSGGEKQRVVILIALLLSRNIFLLDEPTAYLDKGLKQKVADYFLHHPKLTVIVISHDTQWHHLPVVKTITLGD